MFHQSYGQREFRQGHQTQPKSQEIIYARLGWADFVNADPDRTSHGITNGTEVRPNSGPKSVDPATDLARCFLRLANLPSYPLDRLSRYEAILWRQAGQILFRSLDDVRCIVANHKREGAVSASIVGRNCWPMDATTIELSDLPIYAIDAELGRVERAIGINGRLEKLSDQAIELKNMRAKKSRNFLLGGGPPPCSDEEPASRAAANTPLAPQRQHKDWKSDPASKLAGPPAAPQWP